MLCNLALLGSVLGGIVHVPLQRDPLLARRSVDEPLSNTGSEYRAGLLLGSSRQPVWPQLDTGSSDLWVMATANPYCGDIDCTEKTFDPSQSSSFENTSAPWHIHYMSGEVAIGSLVKDTIDISGSSVHAEFAVADISNSSDIVFGVGFQAQEASLFYATPQDPGTAYPTVLMSMQTQGLIDRLAYSLFLDSAAASSGAILFGGVDHAKYQGELSLVPMIDIYGTGNITDFRINLNGISTNTSTCLAQFSIPFLLDSGTTNAFMPSELVDAMAAQMGYNHRVGSHWRGPCTVFPFDFELNFSGTVLAVPPASLTSPIYGSDGSPHFHNGQPECVLEVHSANDFADYILGDIFLRNFYVVYDLERAEVALAPAVLTEATRTEAITAGIPGATQAPKYSATAFSSAIQTC